MPLWQVFHPPSAFATDDSKQALVNDITKLYTGRGLPAFYVIVQFHPLEAQNFFMGGIPATNFVRLVIHHLAFHSAGSPTVQKQVAGRVDAVLQPHLAAKGLDWEYHIVESPPTLWKINGFVPPVMGHPAIKKWVADNKPSPYSEEGNTPTGG